MKTISLKLPAGLHGKLNRAAKQRKQSKSDVVRTALEQFLNGKGVAQRPMSALELAGDLVGCGGARRSLNQPKVHGRVREVIHNVLLDAGPLAALVNPRDQWHEWVRSQFGEIVPPLVTCESAISEACFLARRTHGGVDGVLGLVDRGVVELGFTLKEDFGEVAALMRRYSNVPMSLADACLVRMSELVPNCTVFTLDSDFRIYRRHKRQTIPLLIPPDV